MIEEHPEVRGWHEGEIVSTPTVAGAVAKIIVGLNENDDLIYVGAERQCRGDVYTEGGGYFTTDELDRVIALLVEARYLRAHI